jgi:hypothetical protein
VKFISAALVIFLIMGVLGLGLGLAAYGHGPWLLILGIVVFLALFINYGCRAH